MAQNVSRLMQEQFIFYSSETPYKHAAVDAYSYEHIGTFERLNRVTACSSLLNAIPHQKNPCSIFSTPSVSKNLRNFLR
jgi:hypothetical protein